MRRTLRFPRAAYYLAAATPGLIALWIAYLIADPFGDPAGLAARGILAAIGAAITGMALMKTNLDGWAFQALLMVWPMERTPAR